MGDTRTVTAKLVFGADKTALADTLAASKKIKEALVELGVKALQLENGIKDALKAGDTGAAQKLTTELDKVKSKMGEVQSSAKKALAEEYVSSVRKSTEQTKQFSEQLGNISTRVAAVGAGIGMAFYQAAQKYTQGAGQNEVAGQAWLTTTKRIETAQINLGREATKALQPWLEALAGVSEWAADFAQKNPQGVQGLLTGGVGLAAVGGLGVLASQGIRIWADVKLMAAGALMNTAADKMLAAAGIQAGTGGAAGAAGAASSLASGAKNAGLLGIAAVIGGLSMKLTDDVTGMVGRAIGYDKRQVAPILAYGAGAGIGKLLGDETLGKKWAVTVAGWTGAIDANTKAAMENSLAQQQLAAAAASTAHVITPETWTTAQDLFAKYTASTGTAEAGYNTSTGEEYTAYYADVKTKNDAYLADVAKANDDYYAAQETAKTRFDAQQKQDTLDFQDSQIEAYEAHAKDLSKMVTQFYDEGARLDNDYYDRRLEEAQAYGEDVARMEADHQKQVRRTSEDNAVELDDLVRSRDALGISKALRKQERERQRDGQKRRPAEAARRVFPRPEISNTAQPLFPSSLLASVKR